MTRRRRKGHPQTLVDQRPPADAVIARAALLAVALSAAAWFATELRPVRERDAALALVARGRAPDVPRAVTLLSRAARLKHEQ